MQCFELVDGASFLGRCIRDETFKASLSAQTVFGPSLWYQESRRNVNKVFLFHHKTTFCSPSAGSRFLSQFSFPGTLRPAENSGNWNQETSRVPRGNRTTRTFLKTGDHWPNYKSGWGALGHALFWGFRIFSLDWECLDSGFWFSGSGKISSAISPSEEQSQGATTVPRAPGRQNPAPHPVPAAADAPSWDAHSAATPWTATSLSSTAGLAFQKPNPMDFWWQGFSVFS